MALSLENANKVRQKTRGITLNAGVFYALKALFLHLAANKGNPDLQFIPFTETQADVAGGTVLADAACKVYFVYVKKENSATRNICFLYDDATNDTTAADARIGLDLNAANEVAFACYPDGNAFGTGVVVTQYSDGVGATDGSNGGSGFVIVGAA